MSDAAHVKSIALHRFGEDFAVEGYIKDPYEVAEPETALRNLAVIFERG